MTEEQRLQLARTRFTLIAAARASGVALMLLGMWIWHGDIVREGGLVAIGAPLFVLGFAESLILPRVLAARWRSGR